MPLLEELKPSMLPPVVLKLAENPLNNVVRNDVLVDRLIMVRLVLMVGAFSARVSPAIESCAARMAPRKLARSLAAVRAIRAASPAMFRCRMVVSCDW